MTLWGKLFRRRVVIPLRAESLATPDGDSLALVWTEGSPETAPLLLLLHGLEGSVQSHYAMPILAEAAQRGWTGLLMHFRTCDGRMNTARRTYHSGETSDLDFVVGTLLDTHPGRPLAIAGVSLGANVLLKWLGERGDQVDRRLVGAVAVSTPFDLRRSSLRVNQGFSRLYQWNFVTRLRRKALAKLETYPDIGSREDIEAARTFWEFDDRFTAPIHGFADAADYYERSSSLPWLERIRVPTLLLSARDDPFHPPAVLDDVARAVRDNPCVELELPARGGHVGFVEGPPWRPRYYLDRRVVEFLDGVLDR